MVRINIRKPCNERWEQRIAKEKVGIISDNCMIVVGTRPEIVKMAPVIRALEEKGQSYVFVHCGQHYDYNMSQSFIEELELPTHACLHDDKHEFIDRFLRVSSHAPNCGLNAPT